eukprot:Hpha_TRINITY_DN7067_c0_g1::TRINITY_DN7067_c0_g1_i1::g.22975::m.22975/K18426/ECHDC1; ethylmalonyl-CoA/methylmalonyl-CoA decarboxylase
MKAMRVSACSSGARRAVRVIFRTYKSAVNPSAMQKPPEVNRQEMQALKSLHEERKVNQQGEQPFPRDPTTVFLAQGRQMLRSIQDGGRVTLTTDTGVPGVFCLELDNVDDRNCMTAQMMVEMEDCVREINQHPECVAVVIRGSGLHFCSGAALALAKEHLLSAERGLIMCRYMQTLLLELHNLPCITVAAIEGGAVGGGAELATAADFRIVSESGRIHFVHTHMGLSTGWGGGTRLTKLVGRRAAILLLCSGKPCYPNDAISFGLADKVSREGETYHDAMQFIKANFLHAPIEAVKGCKDVIAASEILSPRTALIYEQNVFASLWERNARSKADMGALHEEQAKSAPSGSLPEATPASS